MNPRLLFRAALPYAQEMVSEIAAFSTGVSPANQGSGPQVAAAMEAYDITTQTLLELVDLSRRAAATEHSYRGFQVGAAVLAQNVHEQTRAMIASGDYTPTADTGWSCAEKRAFELAKSRGFQRIMALAVTGPPYNDLPTDSAAATTCMPCARCRDMLEHSDMATADMLVATASTADIELLELSTVEALLGRGSDLGPQAT